MLSRRPPYQYIGCEWDFIVGLQWLHDLSIAVIQCNWTSHDWLSVHQPKPHSRPRRTYPLPGKVGPWEDGRACTYVRVGDMFSVTSTRIIATSTTSVCTLACTPVSLLHPCVHCCNSISVQDSPSPCNHRYLCAYCGTRICTRGVISSAFVHTPPSCCICHEPLP